MIGQISKNTPLSSYAPSDAVREFTAAVQKDYFEGIRILERPFTELNNRSVIEDENRGQKMFNAFVDETVDDSNEAWKWIGTRSMARNKGIAMHANLTGNYLLPIFTAQNDQDETDRDFSEVMRDVIEWMASPTNSNYQESFLNVSFGMMHNPVTYLGAEFFEVYQKIRERQKDGSYTPKEILDEELSGFKAAVYSSSQVLITNPYERNIQKQRRIIKRRWCEKEELEAKYRKHPNWVYVQTGIRSVYDGATGLFYDIRDEDHPYLVTEETALSRRDDSEVCFLNGIYVGNENVENNPMRHRNERGAPKYNIIPFGYARIGQHFFYYKSMMNALGWDNMLYDAMSEVVMNRAFLEMNPPIAVSGDDKIDSEVIFPSSVVASEKPDFKVTPILPASNMAAGFNALRETEKSMEEGSVNDTIAGQLPEASQKAYTVAQAQANAKKLISAVGKSLTESVIQYGSLMKDIALNHITVPHIGEILGGSLQLKYRTLILEGGKTGRMNGRKIRFDSSLIGKEISDKKKEERSLQLLEEMGYPENKESLVLVNPELFAKFRYLTRVDVEEMFVKNAEYWQPILGQLYTLLANNQYVKMEELTRELLYSHFQSRGDDFMQKQPSPLDLPVQVSQNEYGQMVKSKQLAGASVNAVQ